MRKGDLHSRKTRKALPPRLHEIVQTLPGSVLAPLSRGCGGGPRTHSSTGWPSSRIGTVCTNWLYGAILLAGHCTPHVGNQPTNSIPWKGRGLRVAHCCGKSRPVPGSAAGRPCTLYFSGKDRRFYRNGTHHNCLLSQIRSDYRRLTHPQQRATCSFHPQTLVRSHPIVAACTIRRPPQPSRGSRRVPFPDSIMYSVPFLIPNVPKIYFEEQLKPALSINPLRSKDTQRHPERILCMLLLENRYRIFPLPSGP